MWQKKEAAKNEADKKPESGAKQNDEPVPVVLKLDMHCEGCVKKINRAVRHFEGTRSLFISRLDDYEFFFLIC